MQTATEQKANLQFSTDGTTVKIIFSDKSESEEYTTIKKTLIGLGQSVEQNKIPKEQGDMLAREVMNAKKMKMGITIMDIFMAMEDNPNFTAFGVILEAMRDFEAAPNKPVEVAYFKICPDCGKHGRIYAKKCYTTEFSNKKTGLNFIKRLKAQKQIDEKEFEKLTKEITESTLAD